MAFFYYLAGIVWGMANFAPLLGGELGQAAIGVAVSAAVAAIFCLPARSDVKLGNVAFILAVFLFYLGIELVFSRNIGLVGLLRQLLLFVAVCGFLKLLKGGFENVERFVLGMQAVMAITLLVAFRSLDTTVFESDFGRFGLETWNPNSLGASAASLAVVAMMPLLTSRCNSVKRVYHSLLVIFGTAITFATKSRTSIVILAFGLLYLLIRSRNRFMKFAVAAAILVALWQFWELLFVLIRWEDTFQGTHSTMFSGREERWQNAISMIAQNPFFGVGVDGLSIDPHNWYLATLQQTGIFGLACYLSFCGVAGVKSVKSHLKSYWPHAILYMGFLQSFVESRLINYGQFSSAILLLSMLIFVTDTRPPNSNSLNSRY